MGAFLYSGLKRCYCYNAMVTHLLKHIMDKGPYYELNHTCDTTTGKCSSILCKAKSLPMKWLINAHTHILLLSYPYHHNVVAATII